MATQQQTRERPAMRQQQGDDLREHQREESVLFDDLLLPIQRSVWGMAQWDLVWSQVSMTLTPFSLSRVKPRNGSPLMP